MNALFETLADQATQRLAGDAELRLEVRRDLLSHLIAARDDHAAATIADPEQAAVDDLGDPVSLGDRLWQTHRRRIWRRRMARWAASAFAWPVAIVVIVWAFIGLARSAGPMIELKLGSGAAAKVPGWSLIRAAGGTIADRVDALPAADRALLPRGGQHFVEDYTAVAADRAEHLRQLLKQSPSDLVVYAAYARNEAQAAFLDPSSAVNLSSAEVRRIAKVFDDGEALDPGNAYYPLLKAGLLAAAASTPADDQANLFPFEYRDINNQTVRLNCNRIDIHHPSLFAKGVAVYEHASALPRIDDYTDAILQRSELSLQGHSDLGIEVIRQMLDRTGPLLLCSAAEGSMSAHALSLVENAKPDEGKALMKAVINVRSMILRASPSSKLFVYHFYQPQIVLAHASAVQQVLGNAAAADALQADTKQQNNIWLAMQRWQMRNPSSRDSLLQRAYPTVDNHSANPAILLNHAEHGMIDRLAMIVLMIVLLCIAALAQLSAGAIRLVQRQPVMLVMPRRREVIKLTLALLGVLGLYAAFLNATSAWQWPVQDTFWTWCQYGLVTLMIVFVTVWVARGEVRKRLGELGILRLTKLPFVQRWRPVLLGGGVMLGTGGVLWCDTQMHSTPSTVLQAMYVLVVGLGLLLALSVASIPSVRSIRRPAERQGVAILLRAVAVRLVGVAIIMGVVGVLMLGAVERRAIGAVDAVAIQPRWAPMAETMRSQTLQILAGAETKFN